MSYARSFEVHGSPSGGEEILVDVTLAHGRLRRFAHTLSKSDTIADALKALADQINGLRNSAHDPRFAVGVDPKANVISFVPRDVPHSNLASQWIPNIVIQTRGLRYQSLHTAP